MENTESTNTTPELGLWELMRKDVDIDGNPITRPEDDDDDPTLDLLSNPRPSIWEL